MSLIDILPIVQWPAAVSLQKLLPTNDISLKNNDTFVDQLPERHEGSLVNPSNVRNGAVIVLWLGQTQSPLRNALVNYLIPIDITLILFSTEDQLWYWLNNNATTKIASLVIEMNINIQNILSRSHAYKSVRSILVRCSTNALTSLQRFSRNYSKIDGVYHDDTRVLIRLVVDLAVFSEELGDEEREDKNNEPEAQRHYDRALQAVRRSKEPLKSSTTLVIILWHKKQDFDKCLGIVSIRRNAHSIFYESQQTNLFYFSTSVPWNNS